LRAFFEELAAESKRPKETELNPADVIAEHVKAHDPAGREV
jgi:hypothetical protein